MSNWYLLKNEIQLNHNHDILINLDKVFTIRCVLEKGIYCLLMDYTPEDAVGARFNTEEAMRDELRNILNAMGADVTLANNIAIETCKHDSHDVRDKVIDKLETLTNALKQANK